jgi:polyisoprenoid-binding protein YceI
MLRLLSALALVLAASLARAEAGLVVVLPLDARDAKLDASTQRTFEESIRTLAGDELKSYELTVLSGTQTLSMLEDNGVDVAKACEASCALEAARQVKAKLFISGSLAKSEGEFVAFVRLFDSASGSQLASLQLEGASVKSLRTQFESKAHDFFTKAMGPVATSGSTVFVQSAERELEGADFRITQEGKEFPCKLSFGFACRLRGLEVGNIQLSLTSKGTVTTDYWNLTGKELALKIVPTPGQPLGVVPSAVVAVITLGGFVTGLILLISGEALVGNLVAFGSAVPLAFSLNWLILGMTAKPWTFEGLGDGEARLPPK